MPGVEFWCAELSSKNLMVIRLILAALLCLSGLSPVLAIPARIIILRHGEKADKWKFCDVGQERAAALAVRLEAWSGRSVITALLPMPWTSPCGIMHLDEALCSLLKDHRSARTSRVTRFVLDLDRVLAI